MDLIGGPRALDGEAAALQLGPLLRHVGERDATIWLETAGACTVTVCAGAVVATDRTFQVAGHHYAMVVVTGLEPASSVPYSIELDGRPAWPPPDSPFPPSRIRTLAPDAPVRILFGSCREPEDEHGDPANDPDVLSVYANRMASQAHEQWPDVVLMLGDQVYADDPSPAMKRLIRDRRANRPGPDRRGRRLRRIRGALRRGLGSTRDPLAPLDPAERDDVRRPRRPRRLEHVPRLADGHAGDAVVGGADHRRPHVLLGLPAPRQPVARWAPLEHDARGHPERSRRRGRPPRLRAGGRPRGRRRQGHDVVVPAGPRAGSPARDRFAMWPDAGRRTPLDGRRAGVPLDRSAGRGRRVRPPRRRHVRPLAAPAGAARP